MREIDSREFVGKTFTTQQLPAMKSTLLLRRVLSFVVPAMAAAIGRVDLADAASLGAALDKIEGQLNLGNAAALLFDKCTEQELEKLIWDSLVNTTVAGADGQVEVRKVYDTLFRGQLLQGIALLGWVWEVNWGDFLGPVLQSLKGLAVRPQVKKAPLTSVGS